MRDPAASAEVISWTSDRFGYRIECTPALLAALGEEGAPHACGLLYGYAAADTLRIADYRPAPHAALEQLMKSAAPPGMATVGWYRSRGPLRLARREAAFHRRAFPEPWQVALVLRTEPPAHTRAAFFFREPGGLLRTGRPYQEFVAPPPGLPWTTAPRAPEAPRWWLWAAAGVVLLLPFLAFFEAPPPPDPLPAGFALRVEDRGGVMRIEWDRRAPAVLQASRAHLEVIDGPAVTTIALDAAQLRTGSVAYLRTHDTALVRMALERPGAAPVEEAAHFAARPREVRAEAPPPATETPPAAKPPTIKPPASEPPAAPSRPQPRPFQLPARPASAPQVERAALDLPRVAVRPRAQPSPPPAAPARVPEPPPQPQAEPPAPAAGRIIWSGRLERRGVVHIEGQQASTGTLSGTLPGLPAALTVLPGELTSAGLRLYTSDVRLAGRSEPPGAQNGWNATEYVWDPARAAEVRVLEPPGEPNGWRRVVLRSETRGYSVIVLRWTARSVAAHASAVP